MSDNISQSDPKSPITDNIHEMKCPACGAPIALDDKAGAVVCEYCGTKVFIDDEIYKYHRKLKAESEAKERQVRVIYELQKENEGYEMRRKALRILNEKPIELSVALLCTIWFISKLISGRFGLIHVLIEAGVIFWAVGAEKRPLVLRNFATYFKNNRVQAIVFVISAFMMMNCFTSNSGIGTFLIALGGIIWSVRSGEMTGVVVDGNRATQFAYVRSSSSHYVGKPCSEVMEELRACGFTDIHLMEKRDLIKGWLSKVGDVASISINGKRNFSEGQGFPEDAKIIIEYHAFQ